MTKNDLVRGVALAVLLLAAPLTAQLPKVGKPAPKFTAKAHDGTKVSFPVKGSWSVLAFYPRAATPG